MESDRTELEAKLAWLENYVTQLDEVVRGLAEDVVALQREVKDLREGRASAEEPDEDSPMYEKPPHY